MAKKRLQVAALDAPTTVKPMASPVDIYTVPEKPFVDTQLAQFVKAITPAVEAEQQELLQYRQDLERSVKQGFADQEAYQARLAVTNLSKVAGEAYTNNEQYYLEAGRNVLAADRNKFHTDYITQLEDSGTNPSVIKSIKQDLELGNIKFFGEVYNPSKQDYDNKIALGTLREQITNDVNAPMLDGDLKDKAVANSIAIFQKAYPNISLTDINAAVRETEVALSTMKDSKGVPRGSTALSKWIVDNNQHTTQEGAKAFATINNNQAAREVAEASRVKTSNESISSQITDSTIENLESQFTGLEGRYVADPKAYTDMAEKRIRDTVESTRETHGTDVANMVQAELLAKFSKLYNSPKILGKIIKEDSKKALNQNLDGLAQIAIYSPNENPAIATSQTEDFIKNVISSSGLTEAEINQSLVDLVVNNAAEQGNDNPLHSYLVKKKILQKAEFADERESLVKALKTYKTSQDKGLIVRARDNAVDNAVNKLITSGGSNATAVNNGSFINPTTNKEVSIDPIEFERNYENKAAIRLEGELTNLEKKHAARLANVNNPAEEANIRKENDSEVKALIDKDVGRKFDEFYRPTETIPEAMRQQINNSAVYSVLKGQGGIEPSDERLNAVSTAINMYQTLEGFQKGFGKKAFTDPENQMRMEFLSTLTRDQEMPLTSAIAAVQGDFYTAYDVKKITEDNLNNFAVDIGQVGVFDFFPFDSNPFSGVRDKSGLLMYMNENVSARMKVLGETQDLAFKKSADAALEDFHIVEYANGVSTAVLKRNSDQQTLGLNVGQLMLDLTNELSEKQGMPEYIDSMVPDGTGALVMRNNPSNDNLVSLIITDESGEINIPVAQYSFDDLNNVKKEALIERVVQEAAEQLALVQDISDTELSVIQNIKTYGGLLAGKTPLATVLTPDITKEELTGYSTAKQGATSVLKSIASGLEATTQTVLPDINKEQAPTAQQVVPSIVNTISQLVNPQVADQVNSILQTSAPAIEAKIKQQRKQMSNRKAISTATKLLKTIDPSLVDTLGLGVRGLEGRYASDRGISVTEQASNAHALLAVVNTLKEQGITDFFLKPVTPDISGGMTMQKTTPERATEILNNSLSFASVKKNVSPDDILNKVLLPIAWHESARTMDATIKQRGGGPAVGIMQFEPASFQTAVTRAEQWSKNNKGEIPSWITDISNELDKIAGDKSKIQTLIASLPAKSQLALATYDLLEHPNADISKVISGEQTITEFWAKYWWAGDDSKKASHMKSFDRSQLTFNPSSINLE